ncbi:MAG: hypothetical protein KAQ62_23755, partial [Cyclobacteriaceae bacterium]|nr:hypothetical protein [Cyclobacteriaceae bacterium]
MDRRKFIQVAGSSAALMTSSGSLVACKKLISNDNEGELKIWAIAAFKRFEEIWNFNDFWKRG